MPFQKVNHLNRLKCITINRIETYSPMCSAMCVCFVEFMTLKWNDSCLALRFIWPSKFYNRPTYNWKIFKWIEWIIDNECNLTERRKKKPIVFNRLNRKIDHQIHQVSFVAKITVPPFIVLNVCLRWWISINKFYGYFLLIVEAKKKKEILRPLS